MTKSRPWVCRGWVKSLCPTSPARRGRGPMVLITAPDRESARAEYRRRYPSLISGYDGVSASPYQDPEQE